MLATETALAWLMTKRTDERRGKASGGTEAEDGGLDPERQVLTTRKD